MRGDIAAARRGRRSRGDAPSRHEQSGHRSSRARRLAKALVLLFTVGCYADLDHGPPSLDWPPISETLSYGVVLENIAPDSAFARAGLKNGMVLYRWKRTANEELGVPAATGPIRGPFDWWWLQVEQRPRGPITLEGQLEGRFVSFGAWRRVWTTQVRPVLPEPLHELYEETLDHKRSANASALSQNLQDLTQEAKNSGRTDLFAWFLVRFAHSIRDPHGEISLSETLLSAAQDLESRPLRVQLLLTVAAAELESNRTAEALTAYHQALVEIRAAVTGSMAESWLLLEIAKAQEGLGDLSSAGEHALQSIGLARAGAPKSSFLVDSLAKGATLLAENGQFSAAIDLYNEALEITETSEITELLVELASRAQETGDHATSASQLDAALKAALLQQMDRYRDRPTLSVGLNTSDRRWAVASMRKEAQDNQELIVETVHQAAAGSKAHFLAVKTLAATYETNGRFEEAFDSYKQALEIAEHLPSLDIPLAKLSASMGWSAFRLGRYERAEEYYLKALESTSPPLDSKSRETTQFNLGLAYGSQGRPKEALDTFKRLLANLHETGNGDNRSFALSREIARAHEALGQLADADRMYRQALDSARIHYPNSSVVTELLTRLVSVNNELENHSDASTFSRMLIEISSGGSLDNNRQNPAFDGRALREHHLPESMKKKPPIRVTVEPGWSCACVAKDLYNLAQTEQDVSDRIKLLESALRALEIELASEAASRDQEAERFARYREVYQDLVAAKIEAGLDKEAFHILERSRSQSFIRQARTSSALNDADLPRRFISERQKIARNFGALQQSLAEDLTRGSATEQRKARDKLLASWRELESANNILRSIARKKAEFYLPLALEADAVADVLDFGTLMLSYSVGNGETTLFSLSDSDTLRTHKIDLGLEELESQVSELLDSALSGSEESDAFLDKSRTLSELLLGPALPEIQDAERLVIVADGPLHRLPFSALAVDRIGDGHGRTYLIEWKPTHLVLSGSVYDLIQRQPPSPWSPVVVAFADPDFEHLPADPRRKRAGKDRSAFSQSWQSLPHSRLEAEDILDSLGPGRVNLFLGADATEESVLTHAVRAGIVHFATHTYLDDEMPLNSSIMLSGPKDETEGSDGVLQAWEILDKLQLSADLVVLSTCESALGPSQGGDGLLSLTRAFQSSGARSVLATIWRVADRETPELIRRFYRHLESGLSKDRALQAAQLELIRGEVLDRNGLPIDLSHPKYWAAFQLYGDWQ